MTANAVKILVGGHFLLTVRKSRSQVAPLRSLLSSFSDAKIQTIFEICKYIYMFYNIKTLCFTTYF